MEFRPALIVVDYQNDFLPPDGSLAVPDGLAIAPVLNALLDLPFLLKIGTCDWHPRDHVSFAANHAPTAPASSEPSQETHTPQEQPPTTPTPQTTILTHPHNPSLTHETRLWPNHCVQNTRGASLHPLLNASSLTTLIRKGTHPSLEIYSAFHDVFRFQDSGVAGLLTEHRISHVFVTGVAADFCVAATACSAVEHGFRTVVVEDATKPVVPETWPQERDRLQGLGVGFVRSDGPEVARVRALA